MAYKTDRIEVEVHSRRKCILTRRGADIILMQNFHSPMHDVHDLHSEVGTVLISAHLLLHTIVQGGIPLKVQTA